MGPDREGQLGWGSSQPMRTSRESGVFRLEKGQLKGDVIIPQHVSVMRQGKKGRTPQARRGELVQSREGRSFSRLGRACCSHARSRPHSPTGFGAKLLEKIRGIQSGFLRARVGTSPRSEGGEEATPPSPSPRTGK